MTIKDVSSLLILGDCIEEMSRLPNESINLILTDPPYGTTKSNWDAVVPFEPMWREVKRVLKPDGVAVFTACQPFSSALVMSNIEMFAYEWVWIKSKITGVLNAKKMPVRKHEQVLVFSNSKATKTYNPQGLIKKGTLTSQGGNSSNYGERSSEAYIQEFTNWPRDVLEIGSEGKTVHPTQKPIKLMEYLILTYSNEGDVVLDFTMGSGTTGVACALNKRNFVGIESNKDYFDIAKNRISSLKDYTEDDD